MTCESKRRYSEKRVALSAARKARRREPGHGIYPYWCEYHGCFHIGHSNDVDKLKRMGSYGLRGKTA